MSRSGPVGVGVIGCGSISEAYLTTMARFPDLRVVALTDVDAERAAAQSDKHGVPRVSSTEELLADDDIELVVNLTIPAVHAEVSERAIAAGRHVWSEKPLAVDRKSGQQLLRSAEDAGVRLGAAPDMVLGTTVQSARRLIESGRIGEPKTALTLMQSAGPESWHPNPEFLFAKGAGPLFDIGPYYIATLVQILGAFDRVQAVGRISFPHRTIGTGPRAGTEFSVEVPTHIGFLGEFETGAMCTSVFSFESSVPRQTFEVNGTEGAIELAVNSYTADVRVRSSGDEWETIESTGTVHGFGLGVLDMARSVRAGTAHRATGEHAYHVLDTMIAVEDATRTGTTQTIASTVTPAPVADPVWDPESRTL